MVKPVDKPDNVLFLGSQVLSDHRVRELGNQKPWEAGEYITVIFHKSQKCGHAKTEICEHAKMHDWKRGLRMSPKDDP